MVDAPRRKMLEPLPLGRVRPAGWLRGQLDRQRRGQAGVLHQMWPPVRDSAWVGGSGDGWERGPYWLDGVIPLAILTDDEPLGLEVDRWIDSILLNQHPDGWLGPRPDGPEAPLDVWPQMPLMKALLQAHAARGDDRIVPALVRLARRIGTELERNPLRDWGRYRAADLAASLLRLHELTGDPGLPEIARAAFAQGYPWRTFAAAMPTTKVTEDHLNRWRAEGGAWLAEPTMTSHGVNVAMGLQAMPIEWLLGGPESLREDLRTVLAALDQHHGQVYGLYSADEHLAGRHPSQGIETCTVVEAMYSLEVALQVWGVQEDLAARLESIAFNALPAAATVDELAHQYDQQANQVVCHVTEDRIYSDNGPDSNIFGLEPHFGCCTANRHQGWPKLAAHLWLRNPDDGGLVAISYAPAVVEDEGPAGTPTVRIEVVGDYPFADEVRLRVSATAPVRRPLHLRVPSWAVEPSLTIPGEPTRSLQPGTVETVDSTWGLEGVELVLRLPAAVVVDRGAFGVTLRRGPLIFVLGVPERWVALRTHPPVTDFEVHPNGPWPHALALDEAADLTPVWLPGRPEAGPFSLEGVRLGIRAQVRSVEGWVLKHGAAGLPPEQPEAVGPARAETLVPYGAARLRLAVLPTVPTVPTVPTRSR